MKIVITGAAGLLGWHAAVRIHARNAAACFKREPEPFELVLLNREGFLDPQTLADALEGADGVLHFAGLNRASDSELEAGNPAIARTLVAACQDVGVAPHIVYANSTHASTDTPYGRSKRAAGVVLQEMGGRFTNVILPHIFGEGARPNYNNVTATFIDAVIKNNPPTVNAAGSVTLLHAGAAAEFALAAILDKQVGDLAPQGRSISVPDLLSKITEFHRAYQENIFPTLNDSFDIALFNSYRTALYPGGFPRIIPLHEDQRGSLFEAVKGGSGGQTFLSWTIPGVTRGDHFHLAKVERFLVLQGEAIIRIRRVLGGPTWEYPVNGQVPTIVDMPTMHTHSIENIGSTPLLTLFWAHEIFNPVQPDTFSDPVLGA